VVAAVSSESFLVTAVALAHSDGGAKKLSWLGPDGGDDRAGGVRLGYRKTVHGWMPAPGSK
jgi:hypothetical protein